MALNILSISAGISTLKTMGRKFIVGGNWKMNGDKKSTDEIIQFLKNGPLDPNVGQFQHVGLNN